MKNLHCEACGAPLPMDPGRGQPQHYCSNACKQTAHRRRQDQEPNHCKHCGEVLENDAHGEYCSERCYYYAHRDRLPENENHLRAYDEDLIPLIPLGQVKAYDQNRPDWHRWVYCASKRPRR